MSTTIKRKTNFTLRQRPQTVTRGLPHYVIGADYQRLVRLTREVDHSVPWLKGEASRNMIFRQYRSLFHKIYESETKLPLHGRPRTVTRGLPSLDYAPGADYRCLLRLVREWDHMYSWHSYESRRLIEYQCEQLHYKVYKSFCYYGGLPGEVTTC